MLTPFRDWVERSPDRLQNAFLDIDGSITQQYTYAEFWQRTTDIAAHIQRSHPLKAGDRVLLAYPPGLEVICAFFACVRLGLIPVPVYPPSSHGFAAALYKMNFIAENCQAKAILTDRAFYWSMKLNKTRHRISTFSWSRDAVSRIPWVVTTDAARATERDVVEGHSDILFLQYTSGSTSHPKGVMVTHDNLMANGDDVVDHLPVGVSWLPQYHDMGLIGYYLFFAMKGGTTYGFSPIDFIRRPELWLETISKYRGTASSAPNFAYEYCLRPGKLPPETFEGLDLTSMRFLMNAAEPVRPHIFRKFLDTFEPYGLAPSIFFTAYGLAEYTLAVSNYGRRIRSFDRTGLQQGAVRSAPAHSSEAVSLVSCGRALGDTAIRIVADGQDLTETGEVGEVWLDGSSKCAGYFGRPELSEQTFRARLEGSERTWLRTGDLGFVHEGELFLTGRSKDIIIVRGQNHYPQDIELLVEQDAQIRKGCVAAFAHDDGGREQVVVVAEVRDPRTLPDSAALASRVMGALGVAVDQIVYVQPRTIAKTSSGKIQRHKVRQLFEAGELATVAQVTPETRAAAEPQRDEARRSLPILERYGLTGHETWTLRDAGLDSIQLVDFAQGLKEHLEEQGHARLTEAVHLNVLQTIAICELVELIDDLSKAGTVAQMRFRKALTDLGEQHRELERELMRRDSKLRFDPSLLPGPSGELPLSQTILLTGGTGFFGPFLLKSLLEQSEDDILVLVRADSEEAGLERICEGLAQLYPDGRYAQAWDARIRALPGDLARTNLGLTTARWEQLSREVHTIVHNGAFVNYLYDYAAMRDANVGGTNEVIRLAMSDRPKVLDHISTTFVFGWSVKDTLFEADSNTDLDLLDFGYSQTKWVSEQVVFDAMKQGLKARIFRPALLTPSVDGGGSHFDISVRLLAFMLDHGMGTTAGNQVSFSPADLAADNIVAITQQSDSLGGTFHVTRDEYARMSDITDILGELTGTDFDYQALEDFVPAVIERCTPDDILFPLLDFFVRSTDNITAMEFKRYDNSGFRRFRDASPTGKPDPSLRDVVLGLLRFMHRHQLVKEGPWASAIGS